MRPGPSISLTVCPMTIDSRKKMIAQSPLEVVGLLDQAFNSGDIEAILGFYEDGATVVLEPGRLARGKAELREAFEWMLANIKGTAKQEKTRVI